MGLDLLRIARPVFAVPARWFRVLLPIIWVDKGFFK